jgi:glycine/D-amino acid oxidase-like deaminating enzyme
MNSKALLFATILAMTTLTAGAAARPHSKTIVVESPENFPVLAQTDPAAMYLHDTSDGRTLLYVEAEDGHALTTLDVTDPAEIKRIARTALPATSAFDFTDPVGQQAILIRYRDGSGVALLSFKHYKQPVLVASSEIYKDAISEPLGQTGLLLTAGHGSHGLATHPLTSLNNYSVVDTSNSLRPALLATIPDVRQRLAKDDTGTLFLLNKDGVSVVRRLRVEQDYQAAQDATKGN